jgi:dTDP-4-amino-4,6-dideoxygalactose transaminase
MEAIIKIAKSNNLELIEDCCHSFGSSINGQTTGSWGIASFNSFEWGKPIIAGIGGSVETSNQELESFLRKNYNTLSNPGLLLNVKNTLQMVAFFLLYRPSLYWPIKDMFHFFSKIGLITGNYSYDKNISINYYEYSMKMPYINKVFLKYSNSKIHKTLEHRKKIGELYCNLLCDIDSISIPYIPKNQEVYYCRFPILVKDKSILLKHAREKHFEISSWYESPVHPLTKDQLIDVGYINGSCENVEKLCNSIVSLPLNNRVNEGNVRDLSDFLHAEYR